MYTYCLELIVIDIHSYLKTIIIINLKGRKKKERVKPCRLKPPRHIYTSRIAPTHRSASRIPDPGFRITFLDKGDKTYPRFFFV